MTALALFDFDGTLCKQDSFTGFMQSAVPKHYFYRKCLKISPQIAAYYLKLYPANRMRPLLFKTVLKDENADQAHLIGQHYAQYLVEHCLNQEVLARLKWHQQQQHQVVIVSASLNLYLQPVAKLLNVELICTQVDDYHQVLTGAYRSADCSCEEKVSRLKQHYDLQAFTKIYAYGNSHEDIHMLKLATHAYWINQKHQLQPFSK
ncbi:MAG: HAD-IB family hydrolase [Acinetobacter populi]|jgi:HAD superfamily hydrolase (TIGR01490 family)|uniref:HAD family hydrolase n=1 Tax=Acinetobacter populi TaxID=1582270 RepID=UPI002356A01B|nr:HAD family hydrolase [Acinetobacter populi]MCH4248192.1 HAD-IB family hydrolase [Acinetobacter populi]